MDVDLIVDSYNEALKDAWKVEVQQTSNTNTFIQWLSSIHPQQLSCSIELNTYGRAHWISGSFNACLKVTYSNGKAFMIRIPVPGKTRDRHLDEKVSAEVAAISTIRQRTNVPVPEVLAWGVGSDNHLGFGPFMLVEYIEGVPLQSLLLEPRADIMKASVDETLLRGMFWRMIEIQLEMYNVDFDCIGSLDLPPQAKVKVDSGSPPLTLKVTSLGQLGGVDGLGKILSILSNISTLQYLIREVILGQRSQTFQSAFEYLSYLFEQSWQQIIMQPNAARNETEASSLYRAFTVLRSRLGDFVHPTYNQTRAKLVCDDLSMKNVILKPVADPEFPAFAGLIDLEFSYAAPAQLAATIPWWLLEDRPTNESWDCDEGEPQELWERFVEHKEIYMATLTEVVAERARSGHRVNDREFVDLAEWSWTSGACWVHMILTANGPGWASFPLIQLRKIYRGEWEAEEAAVPQGQVDEFVAAKMMSLQQYRAEADRIKSAKAEIEEGRIKLNQFKSLASQLRPQLAT